MTTAQSRSEKPLIRRSFAPDEGWDIVYNGKTYPYFRFTSACRDAMRPEYVVKYRLAIRTNYKPSELLLLRSLWQEAKMNHPDYVNETFLEALRHE